MNKAIGTGSIDRSARVRRIKRVIIGIVLIAVLLPTVLCILLFYKINRLENEIADLSLKTETISIVTDSTYIREPKVASPDEGGGLTVENIYNEKKESVYYSLSEADKDIAKDKARRAEKADDRSDAGTGVISVDDAIDSVGSEDLDGSMGSMSSMGSAGSAGFAAGGLTSGQATDVIDAIDAIENSSIGVDNRVIGFSSVEDEEPGEGKVKKVYLTFDDGPSSNTHRILDILNEYGVKGTFFVVGRLNDTTAPLYKRIVDEGHTIGMHSYSHKYNEIYANEDAFLYDIEKIQTLIYEQTGVMPHYYRFPGGSSNTVSRVPINKLKKLLSDRGIIYYDWNVSSGDATSTYGLPEESIVKNCISASVGKDEVMILMHDLPEKFTTTEALPEIIEYFQGIGAEILPIDETSGQFLHGE